ncbi:hypothetical protein SAMN06298224_2216 [Fibrobacter sp. UWB16]|uniref:hypothetical protein n=1 Tax=Fibrobacter sp. UWB16 TaxID=1945874 RepID=UPI000BCCB5B6|nr:hypothetical protein [Fibrobacter sp. UWB16]SOD15762.1 hypothetical protein SAMN06298224_2216 [Fibrobacter sp. UWB16]
MPIPLIVGGIVAGLVGVKKAYDAHETSKCAESIDSRAHYERECAKEDAERRRVECQKSLEKLGSTKFDILNNGIAQFVRAFKKVKNIDERNSVGLDELSKLLSKEELVEMQTMGSLAESVANGAVGGVATGALVALGAYGVTSTFGVTATTGALISNLSGAAATKATLASLGGGALSVGGLGVVGGKMVLGSVALGPALAVMGFVMNAKAEEKLENARANRAKSEQYVEQCRTLCSTYLCIKMRSDTISGILNKLRSRLMSANRTIERIIARYEDSTGTADFRSFSDDEKKSLAAAAALAKSVKSILDTPVLTQDGKLTPQSEIIAEADYDDDDMD